MTDFVNRKQRLSKKEPSADFRLADSDDFFGFSEIKEKMTITDVLLTIVGVAVLWAVLVLWFSF